MMKMLISRSGTIISVIHIDYVKPVTSFMKSHIPMLPPSSFSDVYECPSYTRARRLDSRMRKPELETAHSYKNRIRSRHKPPRLSSTGVPMCHSPMLMPHNMFCPYPYPSGYPSPLYTFIPMPQQFPCQKAYTEWSQKESLGRQRAEACKNLKRDFSVGATNRERLNREPMKPDTFHSPRISNSFAPETPITPEYFHVHSRKPTSTCRAKRGFKVQSLSEMSHFFTHMEADDQEDIISLMLHCTNLEKKVEKQNMAINMFEHDLEKAKRSLRFPPELKALEDLDVSGRLLSYDHIAPEQPLALYGKLSVLPMKPGSTLVGHVELKQETDS